MTADRKPLMRWIAAVPTGMKMLVVLSLALLPLGLIALFASIETATEAREGRQAEVRLLAESSAQRLSSALFQGEISLRAAATFIDAGDQDVSRCVEILNALARLKPYAMHFEVFGDGDQPLCASRVTEISAGRPALPGSGEEMTIAIDAERKAIVSTVWDADGGLIGLAALPEQSIAALTQPNDLLANHRLAITDGDKTLLVSDWSESEAPGRFATVEQEIEGSDLRFVLNYEAAPLTMAEMLSIALPLLIWVSAALLGWLAVQLLLIRPLARLRKAVAAYHHTGSDFALPRTQFSTLELRELGEAFDEVIGRLRANELELQAGLVEQRRLTREVHHRVKNNLQIISSLLSLHARAAKSEDSAAAYASIQRRVDALAIVQRNLFAEIDNRDGLALRPILAEIASSLQQSAPASTRLVLGLDIEPLEVEQDIAAPVAFLIVEIVELAILCGDIVDIDLLLERTETGMARLTLASPVLAHARDRSEFPRYERVITGLARQLRAELETTPDFTSISIAVPIIQIGDNQGDIA